MDDLKATALGAPYLRFLALTLGTVAVLMVVGLVPTRHLAGESGALAMVAGCAIAIVGALVGTVPVVLARERAAAETVPAVLLSIVLRLGVVVLLAFAAMRSGWFEPAPLLLWLVLSHAFLQVADLRFVKQVLYSK